MTVAEAYGELRRLGRPIVTTREAATRLRASPSSASRLLRGMEKAGLALQLRQGLWALDPEVDPFVVPPYLTAPFPAYVSMWSAMLRHGMIEQIPGRVSVASLDRARRVDTAIGGYSIHHLAPEVFEGYDGSESRGYLATPEKALFDTVYVRGARGIPSFFPELELPHEFRPELLDEWTNAIPSARQRTLVSRGLDRAFEQATREEASAT